MDNANNCDSNSRATGFIQFENLDAADNTIKYVNGMLINGRIVYDTLPDINLVPLHFQKNFTYRISLNKSSPRFEAALELWPHLELSNFNRNRGFYSRKSVTQGNNRILRYSLLCYTCTFTLLYLYTKLTFVRAIAITP